jgi:hypothetical protein
VSIHQKAARIQTIIALLIVTVLVAFLSLKATNSIDNSTGHKAFGPSNAHPLDKARDSIIESEPMAMP